MPTKISLGFTGTRKGMTSFQAGAFMRLARKFYGCFHEGQCTGADEEATEMIDRLSGYVIHSHPPINKKYLSDFKPRHSEFVVHEPASYGDRDLDIVIASKVMIATPSGFKEMRRGSGTWLTIRLARAELKPLAIIYPDGRTEYEGFIGSLRKLVMNRA